MSSSGEEEALQVPKPVDYGSISAPELPSPADEKLPRSVFLIILISLFIYVFLSALDSTMVATLLGVIASDMNELENVSWVAASYLLSCAAFQPLFGKISDIFGRKPIVQICAILFAIGCAMCGITTSFWSLVAGRFITGIGGGGLNAMASITVSDIVSKRQRGLYQGYLNIFFHCGAASGGVIAGVFERLFGWRSAFLVQVPVCLICIFLTQLYFQLPKSSVGNGMQGHGYWKKLAHIDYTGSFILVSALLALMLAASFAGQEQDSSPLLFRGLVLYSVFGLVSFYYYDLKVASQPIIPIRLLHNRTVLASSLCCWFISMNLFTCLFYLPFYWSAVKNLSPLECGMRLILGSFAASVSSMVAGYIIRQSGRYWRQQLYTGIVVVLGSLLVFSSRRNDSVILDSLVNVPLRYGTSSVITILLIAMISSVKSNEQALVTSIQYGFRSTGSTLGVSLASALLQFSLRGQLNSRFAKLSDIPEKWVGKLDLIKNSALADPSYTFTGAPQFARNAILDSYDYSCHIVFGFLIVTGLLSLVSICFIEDHDLESDK
ncbi:hypothetical protein OGAPHI_004685 [Ogataea philodendri]|uniref:Major facilitator superfamily (MFS) profile domain-containing protein n=1 Tax=Ogataea philodendri TaxID=1378263 RepID=A0A9P8P2S4_9ASCO|nr:uncharacterized protein OGAPHI_004685 [Ogataea philodendri]KAH3663971.1 hypothetical protein OGAPHI_004685 [Ogataea philodendri]